VHETGWSAATGRQDGLPLGALPRTVHDGAPAFLANIRLATDAAHYTDGAVERVVITVPAYFGAQQKEATNLTRDGTDKTIPST